MCVRKVQDNFTDSDHSDAKSALLESLVGSLLDNLVGTKLSKSSSVNSFKTVETFLVKTLECDK